MYITRTVEADIRKWLFKKKIVIIYGARQTGKSTLVKKILEDFPNDSNYLNGDEGRIKRMFENSEDVLTLGSIIGKHKVIVIDEAQKIRNIGLKLKILVDNFPDQQIIATGSSSFDLANVVNEPLTGRNVTFSLYPFSIGELSQIWDRSELYTQLENLLIYGTYPSVITAGSQEEKTYILKQLASDYLYKDILSFDKVRKSDLLKRFGEALSLQVGQESSFNELANLLQINRQTVLSYMDIMEQGFIIFRLTSYSKNLRSEINRSRKIFFYDNGIRNVLINGLNPLSLRTDVGALWENFIVSEIKKKQFNIVKSHPLFFWRTYDQQEIDLVENYDGKLQATEIKWQKPKKHPPKNWLTAYPDSEWRNITKDNFLEVLL